MPAIDLPDGPGEMTARMWSLQPALGAAVHAFGAAVQAAATLPLRELEAARMRIAQINGCRPCREARPADMAQAGIYEAFYAGVGDPAQRGAYSPREALAIGFAERFAEGKQSFDEHFWHELTSAYTSAEIVQLATCVAKWLAIGRINAVLDMELSCPVEIPARGAKP